MKELTPKQQRVLNFIRETLAARQTPPTRAEIAQGLGFASANAAQAHLHTLERKGVIELNARRSRGIRLVDTSGRRGAHDDAGEVTLAVVGRVAAGAPVLAVEHVERYYRLDRGLFSARPDYLLRVRGQSMTGAGIFDGDLLAVRAAHDVRAGQIAVFRWDNEVTVKRYRPKDKHIVLAADNPDYPDITVEPAREALSLEGIAVGVIRAL